MKALKKIYSTGREEDVITPMTFDEIQVFVGGYVQLLDTETPRHKLAVNEDGLMRQLPINPTATGYLHGKYIASVVVGNVVLVRV